MNEFVDHFHVYGGVGILDQGFTGFAALPAPAAGRRDWWTVLGVGQGVTDAEITDAHRGLAFMHHPDPGGDPARMAEINADRDEGLKA